MARRAINVEALSTALQNLFRYFEGHVIAWADANLSRVEVGIVAQLPACYGALDWRSRRALVGEEIAARERILSRLHVHIDAAATEHYNHDHDHGHAGFAEEQHFSWAPPK